MSTLPCLQQRMVDDLRRSTRALILTANNEYYLIADDNFRTSAAATFNVRLHM